MIDDRLIDRERERSVLKICRSALYPFVYLPTYLSTQLRLE